MALRLIIVAGESKSEVTRRKTQRCEKRKETFWQTSRLSPASSSLRGGGQQRPVAARPWLPCPASGCAVVRAGLLTYQALISGGRGPVGPGVRRSWSPSARLYGYSKPLTLNLANPAEKGLLALVFWLSGWHQYLHHDVNWGLLSRCLLWP